MYVHRDAHLSLLRYGDVANSIGVNKLFGVDAKQRFFFKLDTVKLSAGRSFMSQNISTCGLIIAGSSEILCTRGVSSGSRLINLIIE